jgi:hypothetical protein
MCGMEAHETLSRGTDPTRGSLFYKTGHNWQNLFNLTARMLVVNSETISRIPEREPIAFGPCVLAHDPQA